MGNQPLSATTCVCIKWLFLNWFLILNFHVSLKLDPKCIIYRKLELSCGTQSSFGWYWELLVMCSMVSKNCTLWQPPSLLFFSISTSTFSSERTIRVNLITDHMLTNVQGVVAFFRGKTIRWCIVGWYYYRKRISDGTNFDYALRSTCTFTGKPGVNCGWYCFAWEDRTKQPSQAPLLTVEVVWGFNVCISGTSTVGGG